MTFEQAIQLLGLAVTGFTTWRGYASVSARLTNYVPVDIYRAKVTQLHDEINSLKIELAVMKERNK